PLIPSALAEAAVRAEADADALHLASTLRFDPGALRWRFQEIETGGIDALEGVAELTVPPQYAPTYRAALLDRGREMATLLERYPSRYFRGPLVPPEPPREYWRLVFPTGGRREGFRHALAVGAWPRGIRRRIEAEEQFIRES